MTRKVLDRFEQQVHAELRELDGTLNSLRGEQGLEIFALNENMLERVISLSTLSLSLGPFDQAILAAILVRAEELQDAGETDVCFCEIGADLQPWNKRALSSRLPVCMTLVAYGSMATSSFATRNAQAIGRNDSSYSA